MGFWSSIKSIGSALSSSNLTTGLLTGGLSILGTYLANKAGESSVKSTNETNLEIANQNNQVAQDTLAYQKYYDANKYSIMANDLESNGLSKTLMTGNTGTTAVSSPNMQGANQQAYIPQNILKAENMKAMMSTYMSFREQENKDKLADAQVALLNAQKANVNSDTIGKNIVNGVNGSYLDKQTLQNLVNSEHDGFIKDMIGHIKQKDWENYYTNILMRNGNNAIDASAKFIEGQTYDAVRSAVDSGYKPIISSPQGTKNYKHERDQERIRKANEMDNKSGKASYDANKRGKMYDRQYKKYYN